MKEILSLLVSLLMLGCSNCASVNTSVEQDPYGGHDRSALAIQHIMKQSVAVRVKLAIPMPSEKGKVQLGFRSFSGSGSVVAYDKKSGHSLVLTAGHVCSTPASVQIKIDEKHSAEVPVLWDNFFVQNFKGEKLNAIPLLISEKFDACVLDVDGWAGEVATISSSLPPIGGLLVTSGAPMGMWNKWVTPYQEGIYFGLLSGIDEDHEDSALMGTSIPGVGGMSGSGVYYKGKLVGVLIMVANKYEHSSYLVNTVDVINLLTEANKKWHPNLKSMSPSPS